MDGAYSIEVPDGRYKIVCSYVGYKDISKKIKVEGDLRVDFAMEEFQFQQSITVVADRAKERETPVAFTDVSKAEMEVKLGSRDLPLVLNTTPSVYATAQGGGAGDARINVRGFNQRNVAIMINGVPVNDMENGWVYWSNWDGISDATASMQVQRGLSAVNIATPSIGGTMNIITDPSKQKAGFKFKQEFGNDGFLKSTLFGHTGLIDNKWAISVGIVRKLGDGVIDKTWTDAWSYYFGAQYNINKDNHLELYVVGAPQRHGQNLYKQNLGTYDSTYAKSITGWGGYDPAALEKFHQQESGRKYNQNWSPVNSSYTGQQYWWNSTGDRHDPNYINSRENFYHKPLVNLNWYSQLSDDLNLYTVLYYSGGHGGGSGTYGAVYRRDANGELGDDDYKFYYGPSPWGYDWNETIAMNSGPAGTYYVDRRPYNKVDDQSIGILRNSVNNQWTVGALVKAYWKQSEEMTYSFGLDWRTAEIEHYREVRDLLGGKFYVDYSNDFAPNGTQAKLGDKVAYYFTNDVDWIGGYAQGEYNSGKWTAYGTLALSGISYTHQNHFKSTTGDENGEEITAESGFITGYQLKGGVAYRITGDLMAFGNVGYVSKVPIFDNVIDDRSGTVNADPENEKFTSIEGGLDWRGLDGTLTLKGNFYYTLWQDRAMTKYVTTLGGDGALVSLSGMDQQHMGIEMEAAYQPVPLFRLDMAASFAQWKHVNDVSATYKDYDDPNAPNEELNLSLNDLNIGDAPQQQIAISGTIFPISGMQATLGYRYYMYFYADWEPTSRIWNPTDPSSADREQSWRLPDYGLLDFHLSYNLPFDMKGVEFTVFAHVFNILDEVYVQDATDNSRYNGWYNDPNRPNGHTASSAEVFLGLPRTFNLGFSVNY
jgi:outer membrane cobalamin receptor